MKCHEVPQAEDSPSSEDNSSTEDPHNPHNPDNRHKHVALHPLCGAAPEQKRCIAYRSGAAPQHTRTNAELAH